MTGSEETPTATYLMNWPTVNGNLPPRERIPLYAVEDATAFPLIVESAEVVFDTFTFAFRGSERSAERGAPDIRRLAEPPLNEERHLGEMNAVFADGHVRRVHWEPRSEDDPNSFVAQWDRWTSIETD